MAHFQTKPKSVARLCHIFGNFNDVRYIRNIEITGSIQPYDETHRLRTIGFKQPNLLEMQHHDLIRKKFWFSP